MVHKLQVKFPMEFIIIMPSLKLQHSKIKKINSSLHRVLNESKKLKGNLKLLKPLTFISNNSLDI